MNHPPLTQVRPGIFFCDCHEHTDDDKIAECIEWTDRDRAVLGLPPCVAVLEAPAEAFGRRCARLLERVTGTSMAAASSFDWATGTGLLYGPARAAGWRTLDAKHFGLPQRRSTFIVISSSVDPAFIFEQTRSTH
jgi:hypothetical protein